MMKRIVGVAAVVALLAGLAGVALAHGPGAGGWTRAGMGPWMMMGGGGMGPGMMGGGMGPGKGPGAAGQPCPGMAGTPEATAGAPLTEERARELAQAYADQHLQGFTVDKVLPFQGRHRTAYSVELKGPDGELRVLHVNPFGRIMPFGGPMRRGA